MLYLPTWDNIILWIKMLITSRDNHYYDEDDIKVKPAPRVLSASAASAAPRTIELTPEEKATAREAAKREYERLCLEEEALESKKRRKAPKKKASPQFDQQPSLFDFD